MLGVVASRNYHPGDVIYSEEPFAKVLPRDLKNLLCESCGQRPIILRACKGCCAVKYCDKMCQKKDWSSHKLECAHLKKLPENNSAVDFLRLLARIVLKLKGTNWKDVKKRVIKADYSFADIDSRYKLLTENRLSILLCKQMKELLTNYIGTENMPGDVDFVKIVGKVAANSYSVGPEKTRHFYLGLCMFDVECIPSSDICLSTDRVELKAIRKIKKGVDKISVRSKKILSLTSEDPLIKDSCSCSDCSLPYGESVLSKILDESKAYSVIIETERLLNRAAYTPDLQFFSSSLISQVDALLRRQEGVLGKSNLLRLRLLSLRCLRLEGHPLVVRNLLLELEKTMREVFGERYSEMVPIYDALSLLYLELGNVLEATRYLVKARNIVVD